MICTNRCKDLINRAKIRATKKFHNLIIVYERAPAFTGDCIDSPRRWLLVDVGAVSASLAVAWLRLERYDRWTDDGMYRCRRHARLRWCEF